MAETNFLRITQNRIDTDKFRVEISYEAPGLALPPVESIVDFKLTEQENEQIRWYLEDYLQFPQDPAPTIAARIETRMAEIGNTLFKSTFDSNDDAKYMWIKLCEQLNDTRIEIISSVEDATAIPWELLRDPRTDAPLALRAASFVRVQRLGAQAPKLPKLSGEKEAIRILLVICRPGKGDDVPFRSVASRLIKGLTVEAYQQYQLDMLRPATYPRLAEVLRRAKADGRPYHIVHFDGHGMYADVDKGAFASDWLKKQIPYMLSGPRTGSHGYLLFENPDHDENTQLIDGPSLGKLLVETDVPVLVLNACRSAHADPKQTPDQTTDSKAEDPHAKVRAFGSLAQEVMDAGVAGVLAMRYNVYVVTAAEFVADLYGTLVQGRTLGEAATMARKQLATNPMREIAFEPRPLQDWCVPIVYEAAPISLFQPREVSEKAKLIIDTGQTQAESKNLDPTLPKRPDAGFFGRDETLLALDRAFDTQSIVLLHAFAGSGKTATAAEFARWYFTTGGLDGGPILFTSFEHYAPLRSALGHFGALFGPILEQSGINWSAITDTNQMRDLALQVTKKIPILWIWDNVEPVAGFPSDTKSDWPDNEQRELLDFLRDARETKAKFLLTSRRQEQAWLGNLPVRIGVPPMPLQESVQLTRALAQKNGRKITDVEDWRPLLKFTKGNPLTITALVGQALRDKLYSKADIEAFVEKLTAGEANFEDEATEGRSKSLGASLSYGFDTAFNENEKKVLALLHFFQGFVDVGVLQMMGDPDDDLSLPELHDYDSDKLINLLDRGAEVGLLASHGDGYYSIHPALPWFFKDSFERFYSDSSLSPARAFAEAMGDLGNYYFRQYENGNRDVIYALMAEEANLLHARRLARSHGWPDSAIGTMQGLHQLYDHTGRRAEWHRLVEEIVPDFVDPATDGPLTNREDLWSIVTQYRVHLAQQDLDWPTAQRLQQALVDWDRKRTVDLVNKNPEILTDVECNKLHNLAVSLEQLAHIQREQGLPECVDNYKEGFGLAEHIGDHPEAAICTFNLGHAYRQISSIRNLEQAEQWYNKSMELRDPQDLLGRSKCMSQLGHVAWERFKETRDAKAKEGVILGHLNDALNYYHQALDIMPKNAIDSLAVAHGQLGLIYRDAGDFDKSLEHFRQCIRYHERQGNIYDAGQARYNVAVTMARSDRLDDALEYARAALSNFEHFGNRAADWIQKGKQLIAYIEKAMKERDKS